MGPGNNFGIKKSNTRYVMVLNPDTILKPNTLSEIFEIFWAQICYLRPLTIVNSSCNFWLRGQWIAG